MAVPSNDEKHCKTGLTCFTIFCVALLVGCVTEPKPDEQKPRVSEYLRAPNEDDDGYDPYSDRLPPKEPLFEEDPWR